MILPKQRSLRKVRNKFLILFFLPFILQAYETERTFLAHEIPQELRGIKIDEKLGDSIDLNLAFTDEKENKIKLKKYFEKKPVLLTIVYYLCPNLCQLHLNGLLEAVSQLKMTKDFEFVALSMDDSEKPPLALAKKNTYIKHFKSSGKNWHFLTGAKENIKKLSDQVGFKFRWNEKEKQFAHLPVAYILTPEGKISRYLYGVEMSPKTIKLSLVEASQGRIGGMIERILLFCFQFDPRKNTYTLYAYNLMRIAGLLTVILLLAFLIPVWMKRGAS